MSKDIELPVDVIARGQAAGLLIWNEADSVHVLTPLGNQVVLDYCANRLQEH